MIELKATFKGQSREALVKALEEAITVVKDEGIEMDFVTVTDENGAKAEGDVEVIDFDAKKAEFEKEAGYALSENQVRFCIDAENENQDLKFSYSGRGMFNKQCPSVNVDDTSDFTTTSKYRTDSMGLGVVMYAAR